jgi:DNA-binding winged helix-turn-helix (wHTH) protein/tetratricopeptide (TPR) repeat protein
MSNDLERATDLAFGDFVIDRSDERVIGPVGPLKIGHKAYCVLVALAEQDGKLLTKDALFSSVWDGTIVSESSLTSAIRELRRALGDESRTPRYIESVYGRGYRMIEPVRSLANASRPVARVRSEAAAPTMPIEGRPPVILVSAFHDEAVRAGHPYLAAELREEVLSGLSRFREIQLVADDRSEEESGSSRRSDRGYQLTATLLPDGEDIKIIYRAKHLADGRVVWAENLSLAGSGSAGGVHQIVRRIIGAALPAVGEDVILGLPPDTDVHFDAYMVAKRRSFMARDFTEARSAAEALEGLIARRPDFALAYPPLVRLYNTDFGYTGLGSSGDAERSRALELAKAGLAADRGLVHAHTVLGFCCLRHDQRDRARECFETALTLNPYSSARVNEVATGLMWLGEFERARELYEFSLYLQPYADDPFYEDLSQLCLLQNKPEEALEHVGKMSTQRLWSSLYEALAEQMVGGVHPNGSKLPAWRDWVAKRWHDGRRPSQDMLEDWIHLHHPLAVEPRAEFQRLVRQSFAAVDGK